MPKFFSIQLSFTLLSSVNQSGYFFYSTEKKGDHILTWPIRLNICLGVARGLHYLHEIAQPRIIHRDIKASNVLLDKNNQAKIADFGLALLFPDNETHITTNHVAGTK